MGVSVQPHVAELENKYSENDDVLDKVGTYDSNTNQDEDENADVCRILPL